MSRHAQIVQDSRASQDKWELEWLLDVVAETRPYRILEIGVHRGYSAEVWRKAFSIAEVVGIEFDTRFLDYTDFTLIEGHSDSPRVRERVYAFGQFDFVFIDGDHTYEGVRSDFEMYAPLVRPGGIVGLHDTRRHGEKWAGKVEVGRFFREMQSRFKYAEFWNLTDPESPGTGVLYL